MIPIGARTMGQVGQVVKVPVYYITLHLWLVLHLWSIFITFMVFITFMGDTATSIEHSASVFLGYFCNHFNVVTIIYTILYKGLFKISALRLFLNY